MGWYGGAVGGAFSRRPGGRDQGQGQHCSRFGGIARLLRLAVFADGLFGTAQGNSLSGFVLLMADRCSRCGLCCVLCRSIH